MPSLRQERRSADKHVASNGICLTCTIQRVKEILDAETPEYTREQIAAWMDDTPEVKWAIEDEQVRDEMEQLVVHYAAAEYMRSAKVSGEHNTKAEASPPLTKRKEI